MYYQAINNGIWCIYINYLVFGNNLCCCNAPFHKVKPNSAPMSGLKTEKDATKVSAPNPTPKVPITKALTT